MRGGSNVLDLEEDHLEKIDARGGQGAVKLWKREFDASIPSDRAA